MKHITNDYVSAVMKAFYNQYIDSCTDDVGVSFEDYKNLFDMNFVNKCVDIANDIIKHPGKYGKDTKRLIKQSPFMKKKYYAMLTAAILVKGDA